MTVAVTAATGHLGRLVIEALLDRGADPGDVVAVVRDPAKAADLEARGLQVRCGDYDDQASMRAALAGAERVLIVSGTQMGRRVEQHANAIDAAILAGAGLIAYTSVARALESVVSPLVADHAATERYLDETQAPAVVLRNGFYSENYVDQARRALASGELVTSAGDGLTASASRRDLAEATAAVLTTDGHEGRRYELSGDTAWTMRELAETVADVGGSPVEVRELGHEAHVEALREAGLKPEWAEFTAAIDAAVAAGEYGTITHELSRLIGHPTTPLRDTLADALAS